jgi:hypothetical protein
MTDHWVHFVFIWYIFSGFGIMYLEKSGNPDNMPFFLQAPPSDRTHGDDVFAAARGHGRLPLGRRTTGTIAIYFYRNFFD